ncbi:hypothetical protein [Trinickia mobilis]|uniref:hypothetical protein n=1 Tax=Trinickia mobilis TaxID=2816356 RepID=UPI001A8D7159|nr:hypothetical protein [Trinickia mobilis]
MKTTQENKSFNAAQANIWSFTAAFVEVIRTQQLDEVKKFLGDLRIRQQNEFFTFYTAKSVDLASGERVMAFSIASDRNGTNISARFEVSNRCISHDEVKLHYPGWRIVAGPRGGSLEEETRYQVNIGGYAYTFGFAEKAPDCLNSIGVGRLSKPES